MKHIVLSMVTLLALQQAAFAYEDSDLDGVEDSVDICPDTPFDEFVDRYGCSLRQKSTGYRSKQRFTLQVGTDISSDDTYDSTTSLRLYGNYRYEDVDFTVSNITSVNGAYQEDNSGSDSDLYLSVGYFTSLPSATLKFSVGTRITDEKSLREYEEKRGGGKGKGKGAHQTTYVSTTSDGRENDYFASVSADFYVGKKQDIFLYYRYTKSGDSDTEDFENYHAFSAGSGYMPTRAWYTSLSYNYTGSIYKDGDADQTVTWYNSYTLTKSFYLTASYSYGLADVSYDNTLSLGLGIRF